MKFGFIGVSSESISGDILSSWISKSSEFRCNKFLGDYVNLIQKTVISERRAKSWDRGEIVRRQIYIDDAKWLDLVKKELFLRGPLSMDVLIYDDFFLYRSGMCIFQHCFIEWCEGVGHVEKWKLRVILNQKWILTFTLLNVEFVCFYSTSGCYLAPHRCGVSLKLCEMWAKRSLYWSFQLFASTLH